MLNNISDINSTLLSKYLVSFIWHHVNFCIMILCRNSYRNTIVKSCIKYCTDNHHVVYVFECVSYLHVFCVGIIYHDCVIGMYFVFTHCL